jgi:lysozyme
LAKLIRHRISPQGLRLLKGFEIFSPVVYPCPAGYPTIGWGHVLRKGELFLDGIDEERGTAILLSDISGAMVSLCGLVRAPLNQAQVDSLISFIFNVGGAAFQRSTLRQNINRQDYDQAPAEFQRWIWAGGRRLNGLIKRRRIEAAIFEGGDYPG